MSDAIARVKAFMEVDLRISPGKARPSGLLRLVYNLHFAIAPERSLPIRDPERDRYISAREIACIFINRYGSIIWPLEPEPAPHLLDRSLQFPRDATIDRSRYEQWHALSVRPPIPGSAGDLSMSQLGQLMIKFVRMVYELPMKVMGEADWNVIAFVLDDTRWGREEVDFCTEEWSEAMRRSLPEERHTFCSVD